MAHRQSSTARGGNEFRDGEIVTGQLTFLESILGLLLGHENDGIHDLATATATATLLGKINHGKRDVHVQNPYDAGNVDAGPQCRCRDDQTTMLDPILEPFGPILPLLRYSDVDEAVAKANDTRFGLAASAWTRDVFRALRATREIRAGCVWVNDHIPIVSEMPHGGYKQSGFGKDMSTYSFEEYTQVKHVMYDLTARADKDWHRTIFGSRG